MAANPFETPDERGPPAPFVPPAGLREAWESGARRLLIWGPNGMGKTRCLSAWAGWAGESAEPVRPPALPTAATGWWLLDEAQHLLDHALRKQVMAALDRGQGVALASHRRHAWALRGLRFRTVRLRGLADGLALRALVARYLEPAGARWDLPLEAIDAWRWVSGGNSRAALRLGYELFEELGDEAAVTVEDVARAAEILRQEAPDVLAWRQMERRHRRG